MCPHLLKVSIICGLPHGESNIIFCCCLVAWNPVSVLCYAVWWKPGQVPVIVHVLLVNEPLNCHHVIKNEYS